MPLNGKKAFCFVALKHHSRFLLPISRVLESMDVDVRYLTAPAEFPFELTLMDEGLPYYHPHSYLDAELAETIEVAYRQVRNQWKEHFVSSSILHHFTLPVQDKIVRMHVENFYLFRRMFEVEKPDFVLALHELNSWGKILGYLSHEFGVPFITLQEGLYYAPAAVYRFHTEYSTACLVWGEATRDVLVRSGGSADKIFVVGNTHLAPAITAASRPETLRETKSELQLDPRKKVVTILMGGLGYQNEFTFPAEFLDWVRRTTDVTIICKWHPVTNKTILDRITQPLQDIATFHSVQQYDTYRILAVSDVCVVFGNSTTGLEALAFGKPLIEVQLDGLEYSYSAMGVAERASDLREVPAIVQRVLVNGCSADREVNVQEYLLQNLSDLGGNSVERAVAVIECVVAAQEEDQPRRTSAMNLPLTPQDEDIHHDEYTCSIIIPLQSVRDLEETLVGIATHTPADLAYECLLSTAQPEDVQQLLSGVDGDLRVITASQPGIAHLCNAAAKAAKGQYLCFIPPGMIPQEGWLEAMLKMLETGSSVEHAKVGIVGGKALFADSLVAHAGVAFDANCSLSHLYRFLPATFVGVNKTRVVPAITGCFVVPREVFTALGGMDEGLQQGLHDIDFCLHAQFAGWQTLYTPHSVCLSLSVSDEHTVDDRLRFYGKWVGNLWPNEMKYWQEDGLDNKKLQQLYQGDLG